MQLLQIDIEDLPDPGDRYSIGDFLGCGVYGKVHAAADAQASRKNVAIKIQKISEETIKYIEEEYRILRDLTSYPNLPDFYGVYRKTHDIWFVMELCEGGPVIDLVNCLLQKNRHMAEEHIAYILKETVKALIYLHENNVMHRDVKGSNIVLTKEGEVKLIDFGLSKTLDDNLGRARSCIGSPCWMAPEVIASKAKTNKNMEYDNRVDVWSLGITAIELGDGKAPFQDMHPTRALFQIVNNPPPTLYRPSMWSENYNDFINECLVKNSEHRPYMIEILEHPFLEQVPENSYHLSQELKMILRELDKRILDKKYQEVCVRGNYLKKNIDQPLEPMFTEDLASLDVITEDIVMKHLEYRMKLGEFQTFIGDILLILNPNGKRDIYDVEFHRKYTSKSRSENAPHIYAVADSAYQNALHHKIPQRIVLSGETGSGKTSNYLNLINHLLYLGSNFNINLTRIKDSIKLIHSLTHASTLYNSYSTRCILKTEVSLGSSGKVSGAAFKVHCLEKWRVSSVDMNEGNFHILYYIYDGLKAYGKLEQYNLTRERNYRYLRVSDGNKTFDPKHDVENNIVKYRKIMEYLEELEFTSEQTETILNIIAAILILGEVRFQENEEGHAVMQNEEVARTVARLLKIYETKFCWALTNYCIVKKEAILRKKNTCDEARDARDVLANNLYCRLVDYIIKMINEKFAIGRAIFGSQYSVNILDYFGFESYRKNHLSQLLINAFNEQIHYHYLQRIFAWEAMDMKEDELEYNEFNYYDNKTTLDQLLTKSGILNIIDEASKKGYGGKYLLDIVENQQMKRVVVSGSNEFSVAHYTGKVPYDIREIPDKNRDYLPPEIIETLRISGNPIVSLLFTNKLDKTGNLFMSSEENIKRKGKYKFENRKNENLSSENQYSQINRMRTVACVFKVVSLDLLKELSIGSGSGGTHFVRCVRSDLEGKPGNFRKEIIKQQLRALAVVETAKARQTGYPHRIAFPEFLRRYQFLAFDFEETVEVTKENCRLLLIRLKIEDGWAIGKSRVFLKYYNEEYLSRLYETQVKKIIKIQCILRRFLANVRVAKQEREQEKECITIITRKDSKQMSEEEAASVIQKAYRESHTRKALAGFTMDYEVLDETTCNFIRAFAHKWKKRSLFNVLVQYRAARLQDFYNFSQQIHLYNSDVFHDIHQINEGIDLDRIDSRANPIVWLGSEKPSVLKVPFRLQDVPYYDTSSMKDPLGNIGISVEREEPWDSPYRWRKIVSSEDCPDSETLKKPSVNANNLINLTYTRDPEQPLKDLPAIVDEESGSSKQFKNSENRTVRDRQDFHANTTDCFQANESRIEKHNIYGRVGTRKRSPARLVEDLAINSIAKPANKDFDYIRASPAINKPKHAADPIAELRTFGRKNSASSDDEPPFNFQGMLRKTNFRRDSLKQAVEKFDMVRRMSQPKIDEVTTNENGLQEEPIQSRKISEELFPGVYIEGFEIDL